MFKGEAACNWKSWQYTCTFIVASGEMLKDGGAIKCPGPFSKLWIRPCNWTKSDLMPNITNNVCVPYS